MTQPIDLPFAVEEFKSRVASVQAEMANRKIDVAMVNHLENIYYLSAYRTIGYYSFMALFLPVEGTPFHLLLNQFWPMAVIGLSTLALAGWLFRHRMY